MHRPLLFGLASTERLWLFYPDDSKKNGKKPRNLWMFFFFIYFGAHILCTKISAQTTTFADGKNISERPGIWSWLHLRDVTRGFGWLAGWLSGCSFLEVFGTQVQEEEEGGGRREGSILHDNTYICPPFCSLSYQEPSLWWSAVVVTGG